LETETKVNGFIRECFGLRNGSDVSETSKSFLKMKRGKTLIGEKKQTNYFTCFEVHMKKGSLLGCVQMTVFIFIQRFFSNFFPKLGQNVFQIWGKF
jgi:hypothetical protein